jgi:hypothetical protein
METKQHAQAFEVSTSVGEDKSNPLGACLKDHVTATDDHVLRELFPTDASWQKQAVKAMLAEAGVAVDGPNPWDIQVHDERFFDAVLRDGDLGVGESYTAGWWDCKQLDELTCRVLSHDLLARTGRGWRTLWAKLKHKLFNLQSKNRATRVALAHYDLGNDFFEHMLGPTMAYSCGYWKNADCLDRAQQDKHDLTNPERQSAIEGISGPAAELTGGLRMLRFLVAILARNRNDEIPGQGYLWRGSASDVRAY